jgi:hypothetical protein
MSAPTYTPPTPHDYSKLAALEAAMHERKAAFRAATAALVAKWDRIDAGEPNVSDSDERAASGDASDAYDGARNAYIAEWKRVGSPLTLALDQFGDVRR